MLPKHLIDVFIITLEKGVSIDRCNEQMFDFLYYHIGVAPFNLTMSTCFTARFSQMFFNMLISLMLDNTYTFSINYSILLVLTVFNSFRSPEISALNLRQLQRHGRK